MKRLCFLLAERREEFVNSLTSSAQTTAQTCGAMGDDCGVQDVPGFPRLTPLASPLRASRAPPPLSPQTPFRPLPVGRGIAKGSSLGAKEVMEDCPHV